MMCERCHSAEGQYKAFHVTLTECRKRQVLVCPDCWADLADANGHRYFASELPLWCADTECPHWFGTVYYRGSLDPRSAACFHEPYMYVVATTINGEERVLDRGGLWTNNPAWFAAYGWLRAHQLVAEDADAYIREITDAEESALYEGMSAGA